MREKKLAIISSDRRIKDFLVNTMTSVIGEEIEIEGYSLDEGVDGPKAADLVMTSGHYTLRQARMLFPTSTVIASKRVITGYNLEQVMMLPRGKKVLVVNHPRSVSEETIENLLDLGINHLEYIPYWKGKSVDTGLIDTAISPGMLHLCPQGIKNVIDIGERTITIQTFVEVLHRLGLGFEYIDVFENNYSRLLLDAANKIRKALNQSEKLRKNQTIILNEIEEGILSVNEENQLLFANPSMETIFGPHPDIMLNKHLQEIFAGLEKAGASPDGTEDAEKTTDLIYSLPNKKIVCNKNTIQTGTEKSFIYTFRETSQIQKLEQKVRLKLHEKGYVAKHGFEDIWGANRAITEAKKKAAVFARTDETILITGESGTGKELFSQAMHRNSSRSGGPFLAMNFAAIPENLVESELFGYEEGAFTGARKGGKPGIFELAHGGTLFLDEIGDAPLSIQARLLRVLEEREIMSLGGSRIVPVDVRVIAATNKDLFECIRNGLFRIDLFYRLSVLTLEIPALRSFKEEIPAFLRQYLQGKYAVTKDFRPEVLDFLLLYEWPGNMRELRNVADYMYYASLDRDYIDLESIPRYLKDQQRRNLPEGEAEPMAELIAVLERESDLEAIRATLGSFYPEASMGRNKLMEILAKSGVGLTESQAKRNLRLLGRLGLLTTGRTKQGSSLTALGRTLYRTLNDEKEKPSKA